MLWSLWICMNCVLLVWRVSFFVCSRKHWRHDRVLQDRWSRWWMPLVAQWFSLTFGQGTNWVQINDAAHGFGSISSNPITADLRVYGRWILHASSIFTLPLTSLNEAFSLVPMGEVYSTVYQPVQLHLLHQLWRRLPPPQSHRQARPPPPPLFLQLLRHTRLRRLPHPLLLLPQPLQLVLMDNVVVSISRLVELEELSHRLIGSGWTGPTACVAGYTCVAQNTCKSDIIFIVIPRLIVAINIVYSQCIPSWLQSLNSELNRANN